MALLQGRKPLGALDGNKQGISDKRVQPARAAKTSHKWLVQRNSGLDVKQFEYEIAGRCKNLMPGLENKENFGAERYGSAAFPKSKSERHVQPHGKNRDRKPLQTLSVPPMKPFPLRDRAAVPNLVSGYEEIFYPSARFHENDSPDSSMSVSLDTISDSSLLEYESAEQHQINDSAFFSCTQNSAPAADAQLCKSDERQANHNRTAMISRRSSVRPDHGVDIINEYFPDILLNMRRAESKYRVPRDFMNGQPEISSNMRTKLVDWLVEVQDEYKLENETLALAVAYSDRFLSLMTVARSKLQLLGTTAMFIAAKYEEIYPPDADEFAYVTADTYAKSEVILMERLILKVLGSAMAVPTSHQFVGLLLHDSGATSELKSLAVYLTEIAMLYDRYHQYSCSVLAGAAISAALCLLAKRDSKDAGKDPETSQDIPQCALSSTVRSYMKNFRDQIFACSLELIESHRCIETAPQQFVREKYATKKNHRVSTVPSIGLENGSGDSRELGGAKEFVRSLWR